MYILLRLISRWPNLLIASYHLKDTGENRKDCHSAAYSNSVRARVVKSCFGWLR